MTFYHYTCRDAVRLIGTIGVLVPRPTTAGGPPVVWATDMEEPDRFRLGLTSSTLPCDRTEYRYIVPGDFLVPWSRWQRRQRLNRFAVRVLEFERAPERWFISPEPVPAALDRTYREGATAC